MLKGIRRIIIFICVILLLPGLAFIYDGGKYYDRDVRLAVKSGEAQVIEVNKKMNLKGNILTIKRIINTSENTYIRYSVKMKSKAWHFQDCFILTDEKGNKYLNNDRTRATLWDEEGIIKLERVRGRDLKVTYKQLDIEEFINIDLKEVN